MIRNSASEMAAKLAAGEITSVALTQAHLDRIAAVDTDVHAYMLILKVHLLRLHQLMQSAPRVKSYRHLLVFH
jgi:Asp-tRNA(Asn)/Glu-tRNA(Gln) amidotransferase A subunit family amidase